MSATAQANLYFLPWVRQGVAAAIAIPESLGQQLQPGAAKIDVALKVNDTALPSTAVQLRGPADVVGIDSQQIVRTDPRPGSHDFESNCFASIEFDRADFPWLFTPAAANAQSKLRPWLCLVVIRKQPGVTLSSSVGAPLPMLQIATPAKPFVELPDLSESWAWAHAQAAAGDGSASTISGALSTDPALSLARLICPRVLTAETDYLACVVPTFELGRRAGLGIAISDADVMNTVALAPAWTLRQNMAVPVRLPVYFSWEFHTGPGGDFAALAQLLTNSPPAGLGRRAVSIGRPGFTLPAGVVDTITTDVEGALAPIGGSPNPVLWMGEVANKFQTKLAAIVNQPGLNQSDPNADPLLAPPLYGRWHAARSTANVQAANWFDELNLDPRWRIAAALGTRVVQQHQEALMASAWEQAGQLQHVNQRLRQLQLSLAVGSSLHARHLTAIANRRTANNQPTEEMLLRVAAPAFSRLRMGSANALTLLATMADTAVPVPATSVAMRRIARQRGPLTRRIVAQGYTRGSDNTWVARLVYGGAPTAPTAPATVFARLQSLPTTQAVTQAIWNYGFQIAAEGQSLIPLPAVDPLPGSWDYPGNFRAAIVDHLTRLRAPPPVSIPTLPTMTHTASYVLAQMNPRNALAKLARATIATGGNVLQPTAPGVTPIGVEDVLMAPSFPQPMYEPLKELSQDLLLPGLAAVRPNSVLGLETNRAFVEAYLIGLNVEMGRELLWRGFPTDQQGTYFKNFWSYDAGSPTTQDIDDLRRNPGRALGVPTAAAPAQFVLLLRSDLLRRYPNALIYLSPVVTSGAGTPPDLFPIFNGALDPDIAFFGFAISSAAAKGNGTTTGYFVVIQEHPTEPRFGLDEGTELPSAATHLSIAHPPQGLPQAGSPYVWGQNAAHVAGITRRQPVRIAIRVAQLLS
jgi:hypothetical protein